MTNAMQRRKTEAFGILCAIVCTWLFACQALNAQESVKSAEATAKQKESKQLTDEKSLYQRLGGYDAISAVVDDFAGKLFVDPKIKQFFRGMSKDSREAFKQKNKNLLTSVTGGPAMIISRPANKAHAGLNITQGDFNVVAGHLRDTLKKFKVPKQETKEVFAIVESLRPLIVERKTEKLSRDIDD